MAKPKPKANRGSVINTILNALQSGDKYGYEIIKMVESESGVVIKQPSLYSSLSRLENQGLISSYWLDSEIGGRRHYYKLTDLGMQTINEKLSNDGSQNNAVDNKDENLSLSKSDVDTENVDSISELNEEASEKENKDIVGIKQIYENPDENVIEAVEEQPVLHIENSLEETKDEVVEKIEKVEDVERLEEIEELEVAPEQKTINIGREGRFLKADEKISDKKYLDKAEVNTFLKIKKKQVVAEKEVPKSTFVQQTIEIVEENGIKKIRRSERDIECDADSHFGNISAKRTKPDQTDSKIKLKQDFIKKTEYKKSNEEVLTKKINEEKKLKMQSFAELASELENENIKVNPHVKGRFEEFKKLNMYYPNKHNLIWYFIFLFLSIAAFELIYLYIKNMRDQKVSNLIDVFIVFITLMFANMLIFCYRYINSKEKLKLRPISFTIIYLKTIVLLFSSLLISVMILFSIGVTLNNAFSKIGYIAPLFIISIILSICYLISQSIIKKR